MQQFKVIKSPVVISLSCIISLLDCVSTKKIPRDAEGRKSNIHNQCFNFRAQEHIFIALLKPCTQFLYF